jgi:uncharacterized sulfatase
VLAAAPAPLQAQETPKYNVLLIISDDLNTHLGCYGHKLVRTPNIDRLAKQGMRFDRAVCQYPFCNPSRVSFLSGRRPDTTGVIDNATPPRTRMKDVVFLPQYFRQHGYYTAAVGKAFHGALNDPASWDVAEDPQRDAKKDKKAKKDKAGKKLFDPILARGTTNKDEDEPDGKTAKRVVQLMEANKDRPFFLVAGFHRPHTPRVAPKKYFDLYPPERMKLPTAPDDDRKDLPPSTKLKNHPNFNDMTEEKGRQAMAAYYGCITFMDAQVGVLLDALERLKLTERTIVIFMSDHGYHLGEHLGLWGKNTLFFEVSRVPLIVVVPGQRGGQTCPRPVELVALYPTLAELCRLPAPAGVEATSFAPLLRDPQRAWHPAFAYAGKGRSVITDRYRYTEWGSAKQAELYDHQSDPAEFTNLAHQPRHAALQEEMRRLLQQGWHAVQPKKAAK